MLTLSSAVALGLALFALWEAGGPEPGGALDELSPDLGSSGSPRAASLDDSRSGMPESPPDSIPLALSAQPSDVLQDVTGIATGRILDEQGAPIVGAHVLILPDEDSARLAGLQEVGVRSLASDAGWIDELANWASLTSITTDSEGRFRLEAAFPHPKRPAPSDGVRPDDNTEAAREIRPKLLVHHPGFVPAKQDCTSWVNWTDGLYDAGVCTLKRGGTVNGRVLDGEGRPLRDVPVFLDERADVDEWERPDSARSFGFGCGFNSLTDVEWEWRTPGHLPFATHSDADGRFQLTGVPSDRQISLTARATGKLPAFSEPFTLDLAVAPERDVGTLRLAVGSYLAGRVTGTSGAPVAGAEVLLGAHRLDDQLSVHERLRAAKAGLVGASGGASMAAILTARLHTTFTDADGRWKLDGLDRARYEVFVDHDVLEPGNVSGVAAGRDDVDVVLLERGRWQLRFEDIDGGPLAVSSVTLNPSVSREIPGLRLFYGLSHELGWHETDATLDSTTGLWTIPDVCACTQTLRLKTEAREPEASETHSLELDGWRADDAIDPRVVRISAETLEVPRSVTYASKGTLVVRIENGTGTPVTGALIKLLRHESSGEPRHVGNGRTKSAGTWKSTVRDPGLHRIEVRMTLSGPVLAETDVLVSAHDEVTADITVTGVRRIGGHVVGEITAIGGTKMSVQICEPDSGVHGSVEHEASGHQTRTTTANAQGEFAFWIQAGTRGVIRGWTRTACTEEASFDTASGHEVEELALSLGTQAISGIVRAEGSGVPVSKATVSLQAGTRSFVSTRTDETGAFRFGQVSSGRYKLSARSAGWITQTLDGVSIGSDGQANLELRLPRAGSLRGHVLTADGDTYLPWHKIVLFLRKPDGSWQTTDSETLKAGKFQLVGRGTGSYTVLLSANRYGSKAFRDVLAESLARWDVTLGPGEDLERDLWIPEVEP